MKVLLVNGSPRSNSNTLHGLQQMQKIFEQQGIETVQAFLQRLFYSSHFDKTMKVGAGFVCARRGGTTASFDVVNKFFTISGMPVATSQYWNNIHGGAPAEAEEDKEGMQTLRVLARNMSFLIKSIALGKEKFGLPEKEEHVWTNFI